MTTERVDRPGSSDNFTTVHHTSRNEVLLSSFQRNSLAVDDQRVATLHDGEVFVKVVRVRCGSGRLAAGPKGHLAPIRAVKYITFHSRGRLITGGDSVRRIFHKLWEIFHSRGSVSHFSWDVSDSRTPARRTGVYVGYPVE
jgi:hypothetical protein